ncbi:Zn-ribbon domain-containing OB-fold protein [Saccharopolyspora phatthalungensis]|uniref:Putative OB-fold protein n=1 Tax=Saccharopolyspora phatthalungensis TaxID=664693 RepID=A0A840QKW8_9PSEU|nr:Zn-ribbon domain-containing OB-fold protein [Saccharopolyspora phatthalungensis]MBB5159693.1 putative OB-fold protein [Saccharopolyspora phatthalungensis]
MPAVAAARPFREGLLKLTPPRLLGSRCGRCATVTFPPREFCPGCRAVEPITETELSPEGTVYSFTVVRQAPPGIEVPYVLAYIDLPEGVRVLGQVVGVAPEAVTIGVGVRLEPTAFGRDGDGTELVGYRFRAASEVTA